MHTQAVRDAYRRYARYYDLCFGKIFHPGRKQAIEKMGIQPGDRVLEVGVGTGLSLPEYPEGVHVTGIDLSADMIDIARERRDRLQIPNVELFDMDAEAMDLDADSFDHVVAMYVLSVTPRPAYVINEMRRVCKPRGDLFIVNHFRHANPMIGTCEKMLSPLSKLLGFHPDFGMDEFLSQTDLAVIEAQPVNLFGYWTLLRASLEKRSTTAESALA